MFTAKDFTENGPWPIDINTLLQKLRSYRDNFVIPMKDGTHSIAPGERELYMDCILAMLNARSRAHGTPLNFAYFEDTKDFLRHLHQIRRNPTNTEPTQWRALAPRIRGNPNEGTHTVGYTIRTEHEKNDIVAFESATETIGETSLRELATQEAIFPGAIHNAAILVLNVQKSQFGCPTHNVTALYQSANEPGDLNKQFKSLSSSQKKNFKLITDSFANILHFSVYRNASSGLHIQGIVDNPNWYGVNDLETASIDDQGRSLSSRNHDHRITREVGDLETGNTKVVTFSNATDHDRLVFFDWLIHDIEQLQRNHPQDAGKILANELALVWRSRQPGWDRDLPTLHRLIQPWDTTTNKVWEKDHPCWQLPFNERMDVMAEMLSAIPDWNLSPTLRVNLLARIVDETKRVTREEVLTNIRDSKLLAALEKVPEAIQRLTPVMWENEELGHWLELNKHFMQLSTAVDRPDRIKRMANAMKDVSNAPLKDTAVEQLIKLAEDACVIDGNTAEYGRILLHALPTLLTASNEAEQLRRNLSLTKSITGIMHQETKKQLKSLAELAVNLNEADVQVLLSENAGQHNSDVSEGLGTISFSEVAATTREAYNKSPWLTFESIQEEALRNHYQASLQNNQEFPIQIDKESEDNKHPLQRLNLMRHEWLRSQNLLPQETAAHWNTALLDLASLTKMWKQEIIESQSTPRLSDSELGELEDQRNRYEELNRHRNKDIINETVARLEEHQKHLQGISKTLTDIDTAWRFSDRNDQSLILGEVHQVGESVRNLHHEAEKAKARLNTLGTDLKEVRKITALIEQQRADANRLLQEVQALEKSLLSAPRQMTRADTPPLAFEDQFAQSFNSGNIAFSTNAREQGIEQTASKGLQIPDLRADERLVDTESIHLAEKLGVSENALQLREPSKRWDWGPFVGEVIHLKNEYVYLRVKTENDKPLVVRIDSDFSRGFKNAEVGNHFQVTGMPSNIRGRVNEPFPPTHQAIAPALIPQQPSLAPPFAPFAPPPTSHKKNRRQRPAPSKTVAEATPQAVTSISAKEESALHAWLESFKGPYHATTVSPLDAKALIEWMEVVILEDDIAKAGHTNIDKRDNSDARQHQSDTRVQIWAQRINELMRAAIQSPAITNDTSGSTSTKMWIAKVQDHINDVLKSQLSTDEWKAIGAERSGKQLELKKASRKDALGGGAVFFKTDDLALVALSGGGERARIRIVTKAQGCHDLQAGKTVAHDFVLKTGGKDIGQETTVGIDVQSGHRR